MYLEVEPQTPAGALLQLARQRNCRPILPDFIGGALQLVGRPDVNLPRSLHHGVPCSLSKEVGVMGRLLRVTSGVRVMERTYGFLDLLADRRSINRRADHRSWRSMHHYHLCTCSTLVSVCLTLVAHSMSICLHFSSSCRGSGIQASRSSVYIGGVDTYLWYLLSKTFIGSLILSEDIASDVQLSTAPKVLCRGVAITVHK